MTLTANKLSVKAFRELQSIKFQTKIWNRKLNIHIMSLGDYYIYACNFKVYIFMKDLNTRLNCEMTVC